MFYYLRLRTFVLTAIILISAVVSCNSKENLVDDNKNNPQQEITWEDFISVDLNGISDSFGKLICKDRSSYMLTGYYENEIPKLEVFISERDTLGILFTPNGYPRIITDGESYMVLGDFTENSFKCGAVNSVGESEIVEIPCNVDWSRLEVIKTKAGKERVEEMAVNGATEIVVSGIMNSIAQGKFSLTSFSLGVASSWSFLGEALGYSVSDNESWAFFVEGLAEGVNLNLTIMSLIESPLVTLNIIVWSRVASLLIDGFMNDKFGSPFPKEVDLIVNTIDGCGLSSYRWMADWLDNTTNVYLELGNSNLDHSAIEWAVVSTQPEWVHVEQHTEGTTHYFTVSLQENKTGSPREHDVVVRLANIYNYDTPLTFHITQESQLRFSPGSLYFYKINTTKQVTVISDEEWTISDVPSWCEVKRVGLSNQKEQALNVTVTSDEIQSGMIMLDVTTRTGERYNKYLPVYFYEEKMNVSPSSLIFPLTGGQKSVGVHVPETWEWGFVDFPTWCTVSIGTGTTDLFTVKVDKYDKEREGVIVLWGKVEDKEERFSLPIIQRQPRKTEIHFSGTEHIKRRYRHWFDGELESDEIEESDYAVSASIYFTESGDTLLSVYPVRAWNIGSNERPTLSYFSDEGFSYSSFSCNHTSSQLTMSFSGPYHPHNEGSSKYEFSLVINGLETENPSLTLNEFDNWDVTHTWTSTDYQGKVQTHVSHSIFEDWYSTNATGITYYEDKSSFKYSKALPSLNGFENILQLELAIHKREKEKRDNEVNSHLNK